MTGTTMNASKQKRISTLTSRQAVRKLTTNRTGNPAGSITVNMTVLRNNPYLFALRKSFHEYLSEETKGNIFSELRLTKKIEAARLLYPESLKALRGLTVKIK